MDENGCTIRVFNKEQYYTWDEFAIKRLEEHMVEMKFSRGRDHGYVVFISCLFSYLFRISFHPQLYGYPASYCILPFV